MTTTPSAAPLSAEDHPESHCQKCGGPNIVWFAANDLWNRVVGEEEECSIVCPICFVEMAEAKGIKPPAWQVVKEATESEMATLDAEAERLANMYHKGVEARVELERKLKDAEATLTAKDAIIAGLTAAAATLRVALAQCAGVICESGNLNNYRNLSNDELGKLWISAATFAADTLNSETAGADFLAHHRTTVARAETAESRVTVLEEALRRCADELEESIENEGKLASFKEAAAFARASLSPPTQVTERETSV